MRYPRLLLVLIMIGLLSQACGKRESRLDLKTRRIIDTTASARKLDLRPVLDSLCDIRQDSMVRVAMDSIVQRRELEVKKIIGQ